MAARKAPTSGEQRRALANVPSVSITATASSPTMKPTLAIAPSLSAVISVIDPACTKNPAATSLTGNSGGLARASVGSQQRERGDYQSDMRHFYASVPMVAWHCTATGEETAQATPRT
jgi:hypothetical protein